MEEDGTLRKWKRLQLYNIDKDCEKAPLSRGILFDSIYIFYNLRYNNVEIQTLCFVRCAIFNTATTGTNRISIHSKF